MAYRIPDCFCGECSPCLRRKRNHEAEERKRRKRGVPVGRDHDRPRTGERVRLSLSYEDVMGSRGQAHSQ